MRQEKPRHLKYLNEFRTQQCLLFLEQQCQFHRPYTCFHWHFPNQKRRRPFKRPDGTFNYNPDVYCDKYDETSGSCADGNECPYAHRNAGDTERRYHPRYFKTGNCIYETMENGACVKNGLHCAFAHGPDDIRLPVYDIREVQDASSKFTVNLPASLEKERVLSEDPKWNEMFHVLGCYKTELCKKPPRMCRQGYSCPFYHNGKDKRRAPDKFLYRSTPCPIVRPGDEWQDSTLCDTGDACVYCHTRTEQQFHPEIYKSTKCNDVLNSGYCPRGPFCAFAHCDSEMSIGRDFSANVQQEQPGLIMETNNNNSLSSNNISLSSSSITTGITTTTSSFQYHRHIPSDISMISHGGGGSENQQYSAYSPHLHLSTPSAVNSNLRILGTSSTTTPTIAGINNSNNNLPPNLMSNLNANFSNLSSIITSPQQQQISQRTTSSQHHHHYHQQHLINFPSSTIEFNKSISTSDHSGRCSHIPPNPMTSNVISPLGSTPNQSCIRGRRLARCTSPRTTSMWPTFNLIANPGNDRQHFTQLPGPSNSDARIGACSSLGVLSPSAVSSTCSPIQNTHFSHSRSRPIPGQFHNDMLWDNFESTSSTEQQYFSPSSCPWSTMNISGIGNNDNNDGINETENDFNTFLDQYHMPIGIASTSSVSNCDDTSRDSGLVLDMTLPPTSPLESNCGGFLNSNLDVDLLSQLTQSQRQQHISSNTATSAAATAFFDDINAVYPTFSQDMVFHSPSDDGFISTHSTSEELDHPQHRHHHSSSFLVTVTTSSNVGVSDCSSLPNFYASNPVSIPGRGGNNNKDIKSLQMRCEFLDSITCQSDNNLPQYDSAQSTNLQQQAGSSNSSIIRSSNFIKSNQHIVGWPSTFIDETGYHRHSSPISSPVSLSSKSNNNRFSSIVGTPLGRVNLPISAAAGVDLNASGLASSASSSSTSAMSFGAIGSRVHHCSMTSESTDQPDNNQSTRSQPYSECSTQGGISNVSSTSSPNQLDLGGTRTSSRIFSHSINDNFTNLPQSPILLSSPFSNPGCDLERLTLRRELDEVKQLLDSKEGEVEVLKKQRDFVTEHLRDSLGVIRRLFHSLNISPSASTDLFKPLFIDTEINNISSEQSTGCCYAQSLSSESNPCEKFKTCMQTSPMKSPSPSGPIDSVSRNPLQQQEALAALFANPLVSALLNSHHNNDIDTIDDDGFNKTKSEMQFQNWNLPNSNYNTDCIQHDNESSVHELKETFNNPCLLSSTCAGVDNGGTHNNSDYNDDDDLFSASGLLSLSNQESCDLDQQIVEDSNTEELLTHHHSTTFDVPTIASTSVSELTTTTTADTLTILTNNTTFEESIVPTTEVTVIEENSFRSNTIMNTATVDPVTTSTSTSFAFQNSSLDIQHSESNNNDNNKKQNNNCGLSTSSSSKHITNEKQPV
ncbi:unnamed protein product [Schistosoma margrebowiei]|nr:unnamed protein product [Schistosoma margrebowiei]